MGAGASKNKITSQDQAILNLKIQRDKLKQYQKKVNLVIEKEIQAAKVSLNQGNKKKALLALKKKKYQEQLLEKTEQQLLNLEELTQSIEYALVEKQVLEGLKNGNDVLKEIHKEMSLEDVERLMDDTADSIAYQNQIDDILSEQLTAEDEEEIMKELDQLRLEELDANLPSVPESELPKTEPVLPEVPTHIPSTVQPEPIKKKERSQPMLAS
ncbi:Snf7-domain-containing protein [Halteromyces radiatus]|uniref:Snf7-domain-containing protein n=1 Tax=Halteromyces radiatus TaxID=101107 RepID=UPI0022212B0A|nr:Snf7-domain-containing protein [Halteromyces radiatus]KAI8081286.1 Snf7-domain-containing protein [Halteromyces radiatus]